MSHNNNLKSCKCSRS